MDGGGELKSYRGVALAGGQSPERVRTVQHDIDLVLALAAIGAAKLYAVSLDARVSPEARLHAGELVRVAAAEGDVPAGLDFGRMDRILAALADPGDAKQPGFNPFVVPRRDK